MRVFPVYNPKLIVKYARIHRHGQLEVKGIGQFFFKDGRFYSSDLENARLCMSITELNRMVDEQKKQELQWMESE